PGNRPYLAIPERDRAGLRELVAARSAPDFGAFVLRAVVVGIAMGIESRGCDLRRRAPDGGLGVRLRVDVPTRRETMPAIVDKPVLPLIAIAVAREDAEHVHAIAVVVERLVIRRCDAAEREAHLDLARVAADAREVAIQHARREVTELLVVHHLRRGVGLV